MSTFLRKSGQPLLWFLAALIFSLAARADSTVVINEIMYHPASNESGLEWIELHNQMAVNMDLSGWSIDGGIQFRFSEGTVLPGGGYLVLAISPATLATATGLTNVYGPFQGRLANSGEPLELRNNNQRLMDAVDYGVEGDWPVGPDGSGVALAKINPNSASAPASNWRASAQIGGTPGKANFPPPSSSITKSILVSMETAWKYKDDSPDLGTAWRAADFDDSQWPSGRALFYAGNIPAPAGEPQPIGTLFSTGLDAQGDPIGPGDPDPHYQLIVSAQGSPPPPPVPATVIENHPAWAANDSFSAWIGPVNPGTANVTAGSYHYRTFFNLTGFDSSRVEITLSVAVDNTLNSVLLNGAGTSITFSGFNAFSSPFILRNGFVPGTNSLEFRTVNEGGSPNPAGFRARLSGLAPVPVPKTTAVGLGRNTCYFRTSFQFAGNPFATRLSLRALADDGAVFYLNGAEVLRVNMPGGSITASTPAATNVPAPAFSGLVAIPSASLRAGANVLAVEVHQAVGGTNDLLFAAELTAETSLSGPPALAFNEIAASAEAAFWIELINHGTDALALDGFVLASAGSVDGEYVFPQARSLAPGACLALTQAQLGFRPKSGDRLFLYQAGRNSVLDAVVVKKSLRGRFPDGTGPWLYPAQSTPDAPNRFAFHDEIVINEIMYHDRPVPASAAVFEEHAGADHRRLEYDQSRANLRTAGARRIRRSELARE